MKLRMLTPGEYRETRERRLSPRTEVIRPGELTVPLEDGSPKALDVTVLDTSEGGCRVRVRMRVENGTPVQIRMLDSGHILQAVVRYSRRSLQSDIEEYHLGLQYFQPGEPLQNPHDAGLPVTSALLTLREPDGTVRGPFDVRLVETGPSETVVIAPVFVYPETELQLDTPTARLFGNARRCGAAIGGYRLIIVKSKSEFHWSSLFTNPREAARYALRSITPAQKQEEPPAKPPKPPAPNE